MSDLHSPVWLPNRSCVNRGDGALAVAAATAAEQQEDTANAKIRGAGGAFVALTLPLSWQEIPDPKVSTGLHALLARDFATGERG